MNNDINIELMNSCWDGDINKVKQLINTGANPSFQDKNGHTPLMLASASGNLELVKYLLQQGADINAENYEKGWNAIAFAGLNNHLNILNFLCAYKNNTE